jgi:hypothetical protein
MKKGTEYFNPYVELMAYSPDFKEAAKSGWGCGYVVMSKYEPIARSFKAEMILNIDGYSYYPQLSGFDEEITFFEQKDGVVTIGFDTAHSWNNDSHNREYVKQKTMDLLNIVNSFTADDLAVLKYKLIKTFADKINNI